ncbi:hypothetical protein ACJBU6_02633 [Exserohilum turcicum]
MTDVTRDYGDLMEETAAAPMAAETNGAADPGDADMSSAEITGVGQFAQNSVGHEEPQHSEQQRPQHGQSSTPKAVPAPDAAEPLANAMPQAILGTVKDENLKNMMMSWYYAGYYTGLHAGQQQASHGSSAA